MEKKKKSFTQDKGELWRGWDRVRELKEIETGSVTALVCGMHRSYIRARMRRSLDLLTSARGEG